CASGPSGTWNDWHFGIW
nr:immunoglobulin heavy chain junction region [Macaca mulatta]